jgi:hypothetical protein
MEKCIRYADGRQVTTSDYTAIKKHARHLIRTLLNPKNLRTPSDPKAKTMAKSKLYYKEFHYDVYSKAIAKLEENFPILALCSGSWKADHVLTASLTTSVAGEKTKLRQSYGVDEDSDGHSAGPSVHKRPHEGEEAPLPKKKLRSDIYDSNGKPFELDEPTGSSSKSGRKQGRNLGSTPRKGKSKSNQTSQMVPVPVSSAGVTPITPSGSGIACAAPAPTLTPAASTPLTTSGVVVSPPTYIDVGFIEVESSRKFFFIFSVSQSLNSINSSFRP